MFPIVSTQNICEKRLTPLYVTDQGVELRNRKSSAPSYENTYPIFEEKNFVELASTNSMVAPAIIVAIAMSSCITLLQDFSQYCNHALKTIDSPRKIAECVAVASGAVVSIGTIMLIIGGSGLTLSLAAVIFYTINVIALLSSMGVIEHQLLLEQLANIYNEDKIQEIRQGLKSA